MIRRRLAVVTAACLALVVIAVATAAAAPPRIYVVGDIVNQELIYRPHAIGLSADGTFSLTGIKYESYGGPVATATGRAYVRGCTPDCAQGKVTRPAATLRFETVIQCGGKSIYSELRYTLRGPLPGGFRRQGTELLTPVGPEGC